MKTKVLTLAFILCGISYLSAQTPGWNWPEDRQLAEEKNVMYSDMMKLGNYKMAVPHLTWLLVNAPDLNVSIYINGAKIYSNLAEIEKEEAKKTEYQDSTLLMYDLRIKYFDSEPAVMNRKAFAAYKFYKSDQAKYEELYVMYKKTFELNNNNVMDQNLLPYMDVVRKYKLSGGNVSDEEVLGIYNEISQIIDYKIDVVKKNIGRLETIQDQVDKLLTTVVKVDCEFIQNTLGPKLKENPTDLKMAKNIFKLSFAGKCLDNPIFLDAVHVIYDQEPTYGMAKLIADRSIVSEDYDVALKYYKEAIELTDEPIKKAELYYKQAGLYSNLKNKSTARDYAKMAITADPTMKDAYTLVGNLYYTSFNDCKKDVNKVEDRAVFFAAYDWYRKAGNKEGMSNAKKQFPTMEEIFTYDMEVGQPLKVGCWINEVVTIQRRD